MRTAVSLGAVAAVVAPPLLALAVAGLTVADWSFLRHVGWSAVHRTPVEWPSLLALGPHGWVLVAAFIVAGAAGVLFAVALYELLPERARVAAWLLGALSAAVAVEAFRPDSPLATGAASWHDTVHNSVYPLIPLCALGAAATLGLTLRRADGWRLVARASVAALVLMVAGLALTAADPVAQLGRYVFFGSVLAWLELLAVESWNRSGSQIR